MKKLGMELKRAGFNKYIKRTGTTTMQVYDIVYNDNQANPYTSQIPEW
jgi:hypothetical protein